MIRSFRHMFRLVAIARTLARHDAVFPLLQLEKRRPALGILRRIAQALVRPAGKLDPRPGRRLAAALETMGPAFIKLGQTLATRPDLVGADIAEDLAALQDRLPPFAAREARAAIEAELEAPIETLFDHFEDEPVAAASIAQVHIAVTTAGRKVAVKVLRPGIEEAFARDLETFYWLADIIERSLPGARRLRPRDVVQTVADSVRLEMDLRMEAAAASELAENMAGEAGYRVPAVDWERTSRRVLCLEHIEGLPINDPEVLAAAGHDVDALAARIVQVFLTQALRDGFFHADLHQGNFFVEEDGTLVAVDFGIMGRLDRRTRRFLGTILWGFHQRDYQRVADIHFEAGYVPRSQSRRLFAQALRAIAEPILDKPLAEISLGHLLAQLLATTERFAMQTQPQLLILQRSMVMAEGLALSLKADANMWDISYPVLEEHVRDNFSPAMQAADGLASLARLLGRLPEALERLERYLDEHDQSPPEAARRNRAKEAVLPWVVVAMAVGLVAGYVLAAI